MDRTEPYLKAFFQHGLPPLEIEINERIVRTHHNVRNGPNQQEQQHRYFQPFQQAAQSAAAPAFDLPENRGGAQHGTQEEPAVLVKIPDGSVTPFFQWPV